MPISGLVATLADDADREAIRAWVLQQPCLTLGEAQGNRLPLVLETDRATDSREVHDALLQVPGILQVDVVFVGFEEDPGQEPSPGAETGRDVP